MCHSCHSYSTFDTRAANCALKEAYSAANRACEAAKVAECNARKAYDLAKAAEEAACQAERAAEVAKNAAECAEEAASKIQCMINDFANNNNCGCYENRASYHDCDCGC